jgi:uncharacterized protein (TIGR02147 family)
MGNGSERQQPNVFDYFDYRDYLEDFYAYKKALDPAFSHRVFLELAGIGGSTYLHRIINNQRKLGAKYVPHFTRALSLNQKEGAYFALLVSFCNEKPGPQKDSYFREVLQLRGKLPGRRIENQKLRFYEKWYYPIIRELAVALDFKEDYNLLAASVIPRITAVQAKGAVQYLLRNGFLKKDANGGYTQADPVISTGDEVRSTVLRKYHRIMLKQHIEALDTIAPEERDITSLTMSVSEENYSRIKKEIQQFRKRLLAIANEPQKPEIVCQTGFQLIPRSKTAKKADRL